MDELKRIRTFIKVVQAGSFSAAAREESSVSSIARHVQTLEDEFGARLLNRNSRGLSLTEAGQRFYERALASVAELDNAISELKSAQESVSGTLRVSLRPEEGMNTVVPALPRLLEKYPDLKIDVVLTNERRELVSNKLDVALWLGELPDSDIIARRLSLSRRVICGSRAYFEKHGIPEHPEDLRDHQCILFRAPTYGPNWMFKQGGLTYEVIVGGRVTADSGLVLIASALNGLGMIAMTKRNVRKYLESGELMTVLDGFEVFPHASHAELYAVYPSSRGLSLKVRVFVDFLVELFREA